MDSADPAISATGSASMGALAVRNTALVLVARTTSRLVALVVLLAIAGHLKAAAFGDLQLVAAVTSLVAPLILDIGFNVLYMREGARAPSELNRYLGNLLAARLITSAIALPLLAILLYPLGVGKLLVPGFALMVLSSFANLLRQSLYALQRLSYEAAAVVLESIVLFALTVVGLLTNQGTAFFLWAYAAAYAFDCAFYLVVLVGNGVFIPHLSFDTAFLRRWFWMGVPFAMSWVLTTLYWKLDVPLLQIFKGDTQVGWYTLAYKPFESLLFIPMTILSVALPALSVHHRESEARLHESASHVYRALLLAGWPVALGLAIEAPALASIYPSFYAESVPALQILSLGLVLAFTNNTFIGVLTASDRQGHLARWAAAGLLANLLLNLALIPTFGYLGAAWVTVATEAVLFAYGWWLVRPLPIVSRSWRSLLAGAVMGVAVWPLSGLRGPGSLLVCLGGAAVFIAASLVLRALSGAELALAWRTLARR